MKEGHIVTHSQREGGVVFRAERGSSKKFGGTQAKMSSIGTQVRTTSPG